MTFETFPYANTQNYNLDWIIKKLKEAIEHITALENVDLHEEIHTTIVEMIENGELDDLLDELLAGIRASIAALEALTASHTTDINVIKAEQIVQNTDIADLKTRMLAAEQDILALRAAIQILDPTGDIGDIADTIAQIQEDLAALTLIVNGHTTQITNILARLDALENGSGAPLYFRYEQKDIGGDMTPAQIQASVNAMDGAVKIGNYWTVTYTDPETLETTTAQCVIADIRGGRARVIVRNSKPHAYNSTVFSGAAGYAVSDIRTYADLLCEAIYTAMDISPIYRTYPCYSQSYMEIGEQKILSPAEITAQSHCGVLLSSMAYFGVYIFGAAQYGGFDHKLPIYDHEQIPNDYLLADYVVDHFRGITSAGYKRGCKTINAQGAAYAVSVSGTIIDPQDITTEPMLAEYAFIL